MDGLFNDRSWAGVTDEPVSPTNRNSGPRHIDWLEGEDGYDKPNSVQFADESLTAPLGPVVPLVELSSSNKDEQQTSRKAGKVRKEYSSRAGHDNDLLFKQKTSNTSARFVSANRDRQISVSNVRSQETVPRERQTAETDISNKTELGNIWATLDADTTLATLQSTDPEISVSLGARTPSTDAPAVLRVTPRRPRHWTKKEDQMLKEAVDTYGEKNWKKIAEHVPGRNHTQCLQRWSKVLAPGIIKGQWQASEDQVLINLAMAQIKEQVEKGKTQLELRIKWGLVANGVHGRTAKQCRERWVNNLDPTIRKGNWEPEEDAKVLQLYEKFPNKWALIAKSMKGRTENAVKVRYKTLAREMKQRGNKSSSNNNKPKTRNPNTSVKTESTNASAEFPKTIPEILNMQPTGVKHELHESFEGVDGNSDDIHINQTIVKQETDLDELLDIPRELEHESIVNQRNSFDESDPFMNSPRFSSLSLSSNQNRHDVESIHRKQHQELIEHGRQKHSQFDDIFATRLSPRNAYEQQQRFAVPSRATQATRTGARAKQSIAGLAEEDAGYVQNLLDELLQSNRPKKGFMSTSPSLSQTGSSGSLRWQNNSTSSIGSITGLLRGSSEQGNSLWDTTQSPGSNEFVQPPPVDARRADSSRSIGVLKELLPNTEEIDLTIDGVFTNGK